LPVGCEPKDDHTLLAFVGDPAPALAEPLGEEALLGEGALLGEEARVLNNWVRGEVIGDCLGEETAVVDAEDPGHTVEPGVAFSARLGTGPGERALMGNFG